MNAKNIYLPYNKWVLDHYLDNKNVSHDQQVMRNEVYVFSSFLYEDKQISKHTHKGYLAGSRTKELPHILNKLEEKCKYQTILVNVQRYEIFTKKKFTNLEISEWFYVYMLDVIGTYCVFSEAVRRCKDFLSLLKKRKVYSKYRVH
jgi:hypothetical protein